MKKILCLCTYILGNRTFSENLERALSKNPDLDVTHIRIESKDYSEYPAPRWIKMLGMSFETLWVIHQKIKDVDFSQFDMVIVQGFEIGWALKGKVEDIPCIMLHDATPTASHELMYKYKYSSLFMKARSVALIGIYKIFFRHIFDHIDLFFPRTVWCGKLLIRDFAVDKEKVLACKIALDLNAWKPSESRESNKMKLLFVGNDFKRKGGLFLLDVYKRLGDSVDLTIISNDSILDFLSMPEGVTQYKDIPHDDLPRYFNESDIFVFPTYKDHLAIAVGEALASGLPVIVRETGGIKDVLIDGYNGYLMSYKSTIDAWIEKVRYLIDNPQERKRMGQNGRKIAEEKFNREIFEQVIRTAIDRLGTDTFYTGKSVCP